MKRTALLGLALAASTIASPLQAQDVTVNKQNFGICAGAPFSSFSAWVAVTVGQACHSGAFGKEWSSGTVDWSFNDGPVDFNGLYFTGTGTFFLDVMEGDEVIQTTSFSSAGSNVWIDVNANSVSRVRIRRESGVGAFGIQDVPVQVLTKSNGANGNGPDGNGAPGNGPHGNGPPGNGPDGNGPPGNGPNGNGPPGPPTNIGASNDGGAPVVIDPFNDLVNQTNSTPEPATMLLVASGLAGVGALARRRRKDAQNKHNA